MRAPLFKSILVLVGSLLLAASSSASLLCYRTQSILLKPSSLKAFLERQPLSPEAAYEVQHQAGLLFYKLTTGETAPRIFDAEFIKQVRALVSEARSATELGEVKKRDRLVRKLQALLNDSLYFPIRDAEGARAEFLIDPGAFRPLVLNETHGLYLILEWQGGIKDETTRQILREIQALLLSLD